MHPQSPREMVSRRRCRLATTPKPRAGPTRLIPVMRATSDAFDEFCRVLSPRLIGALVLQCGDRSRAEDLAQEALARAWARWPAVSAMNSPQGWVFTVAFRLVIGGQRRRSAEDRANARAVAGREPHGDRIDDLVVDRAVIEAALQTMPARQRAVIALRYYAGFSVSETAEIMTCAEGTVKALTSQAIARLRPHLESDPSVRTMPTAPGGEA